MQHSLRTFYTIILTQTVSLIGSKLSSLAIGIYVYNQTGNATPLALVAFFLFLPQVLISGFAGALADRYDRRKIMMLSDLGQAVGTVFLFLSFASSSFEVWHLYVVTFIQSIASVFQGPAFTAATTMLVPDEHRDRANAIQQITGPAAGIVAPAIAGLLYAAVGVTGIIVIDLLSFLVAVGVIFFVQIPRPERTSEGSAAQGSLLKESFGGWGFLAECRPLLALLLSFSLVNFLVAGLMSVLTPYLLSRTGSEVVMGTILSVTSLGALVGGILMGVTGGTKTRIHTILPGLMIASLFLMMAGAAQTPVLIGLGLFLLTVPIPFANASFISMLQAKVPPDIQGRVFAAMGQISMLLLPISYLLVGPLVDNIFEPAVGQPGWETFAPLVGSSAGAGIGLMMVIGGLLTFIVVAFMYALPSIRHMEKNLPDYAPTAASEKPSIESVSAEPAVASTAS